MKFVATRLELLASFAFLWVCAGVFWPPIPYFTKTALQLDATDPISTGMHALFLGFLLVAAVVNRRDMVLALRSGWPVAALVILAFLSAFWSDAPELVIRRAGTLGITTLFAMYIAIRLGIARLVAMLVLIGAAGALGSFVMLVAAPNLALGGSLDYPNAIRGAFTAKNTLGGVSAMGILIASYSLWRGYGSRLIAIALIPANLVLLVISQSVTALVLVIAGGYVAVVAGSFRNRNAFGFAIGFVLAVVGLAAAGIIALGYNEALALLGRNATLTGRAEIWRMSLADIGHRPWLGFGYGAFWRHDTVEAWTMWRKLFWTVPHAHNGWLELGLNLGIVGMLGVSLVWLAGFIRGLRILAWPAATHAVFCLALLAAILVENLTEYEFLRADSIFWALFAIGFVYLGQEILERRAMPVTRPAARPKLGPLVPAQPSARQIPVAARSR